SWLERTPPTDARSRILSAWAGVASRAKSAMANPIAADFSPSPLWGEGRGEGRRKNGGDNTAPRGFFPPPLGGGGGGGGGPGLWKRSEKRAKSEAEATPRDRVPSPQPSPRRGEGANALCGFALPDFGATVIVVAIWMFIFRRASTWS